MQSSFEKKDINICLIGDSKQIQQFMRKAQHAFGTFHDLYYCERYGEKFAVWPFFHSVNTNHQSFEEMLVSERHQKNGLNTLYCMKAIIYLNPLPSQKAFWESLRDQSKCIAIDYDPKRCNPKEYCYEIEKLIQSNAPSKFVNIIMDRSLLILMSNKDEKSAFADIPQDIAQFISSLTFMLADKQPAKSIFQAIPSKSVKQVLQSSCSMQ